MDPTLLLWGALAIGGAAKRRQEEEDRKQEREDRDAFWAIFHDDMDRTFKRGRHRER